MQTDNISMSIVQRIQLYNISLFIAFDSQAWMLLIILDESHCVQFLRFQIYHFALGQFLKYVTLSSFNLSSNLAARGLTMGNKKFFIFPTESIQLTENE